MTQPFTVRAFLVCDDVRTEISGKEILIGVYADTLLLPNFPAQIGKLCFRITLVNITIPQPKAFSFQIFDSEGASKSNVENSLSDAFPKAHATFTFIAHNVKFEKETELIVQFGIDCVPVEIGRLAVRLASSDEEKKRVVAART